MGGEIYQTPQCAAHRPQRRHAISEVFDRGANLVGRRFGDVEYIAFDIDHSYSFDVMRLYY